MSALVAPSGPRPFRALVRRDFGVAAPIALTAVALVALAAVALAGLPLLGRGMADALAVDPSAGLMQRLSLLPDLLRVVLLLVPGWCAAAMAVADGQHRLGALGAAIPVDAAIARRARAAVLLGIGAPFAVLLAAQVAVTPDDATHVLATHVLLRMNVGTLFVLVVLGSISLVSWANVVGRACRHVPMACASATVASSSALAAGMIATWGTQLLVGWVVNQTIGFNDLPPRLSIATPLDVIQSDIRFGGSTLLLSGGFAASIALGVTLPRSLRRAWRGGRPRAGAVRPASIGRPVIAFLAVALGFGIAGAVRTLDSSRYDLDRARGMVREARELQALPAGTVLERFVTAQPGEQFLRLQLMRMDLLVGSCWTGLRAAVGMDPFIFTSDPVAAAVVDTAERYPAEVRAAAAAIAGDTTRPLASRLIAASWLGPAAAAEFAVRELPLAKDQFARWLLITTLAQTLSEGALADSHAVATGASGFPPVELTVSRPEMAPGINAFCCGMRLDALIMLQLLRWQADGTHRTSISRCSLGVQFAPTLTVAEIDAARRVLEQPLPEVVAEWRAAWDAQRSGSGFDLDQLPDPDPFHCLDRPLSALLNAAKTDPVWLLPASAPAAK